MNTCEMCGHRADVEPQHTPACPHWWYEDQDNGAWM